MKERGLELELAPRLVYFGMTTSHSARSPSGMYTPAVINSVPSTICARGAARGEQHHVGHRRCFCRDSKLPVEGRAG